MDENNDIIEENNSKASISKQKKETKAKAMEEAKDRKNLLRFLGFFVVMIIVVYTFADKGEPKYNLSPPVDESKPTTRTPPDFPEEEDARFIAQMFVKKQLPTNSAKFVNEPSFLYYPNLQIYKFVGLVDFVNVFNAPLRRTYYIQIKYKGGNKDLPSSYEKVLCLLEEE